MGRGTETLPFDVAMGLVAGLVATKATNLAQGPAWCTDQGCGRTDPEPRRGQARRT